MRTIENTINELREAEAAWAYDQGNQAWYEDRIRRLEGEIRMLQKFQVGISYYCRLVCSYDTVLIYTVIKRTTKTVTLEDQYGEIRRRKIHQGTTETVAPEGNYSMAPTLRADQFC